MLNRTSNRGGAAASQAATTAVHVEPRKVSGRHLAHTRRSAVQRALLAADIAAGRTIMTGPTLRQAILLTGASPTYAAAAAKLNASERRSVANGWRPLIPQIARRPSPVPAPTFGDAWDRATHAEREAVVRPRVAEIWNTIEKVIA